MNEEHEQDLTRYYRQREAQSTHPAGCKCPDCAAFYDFEDGLVARGLIKLDDIRTRVVDPAWSSESGTE